jgi:hypothetical protein
MPRLFTAVTRLYESCSTANLNRRPLPLRATYFFGFISACRRSPRVSRLRAQSDWTHLAGWLMFLRQYQGR